MIVHASISEHGNTGWDGRAKAGDQTGREVYTRAFYRKPWNIMLRYKDAGIALKASKIAVKLAHSNLVGYDQSERNTLYKALKKHNWDVDAYIRSGKKTETDCSAFVYACFCCVVPGMRSSGNAPTTATMRAVYRKHGFGVYVSDKYLSSDAYLKPGDVLVKEHGHTAMNVSTGSKVTVKADKPKKDNSGSVAINKSPKFKGIVTAESLSVRTWAGTEHAHIKSKPYIKKGTRVEICDTIKDSKGDPWYYIRIKRFARGYVHGFVSAKHIKKC